MILKCNCIKVPINIQCMLLCFILSVVWGSWWRLGDMTLMITSQWSYSHSSEMCFCPCRRCTTILHHLLPLAILLNYLFSLSLSCFPCSFRMGNLTVPIFLQTVFISVRKLTRSWLGLSGITWWAYELKRLDTDMLLYKPDNILLIYCV